MKLIRKMLLAALMVFPAAVMAEPIDINTADAAAIAAAMKGVGESKAAAIVSYREKHGPFSSVYDLTKVKGIGKKTVEANLDNITVNTTSAKR